MAELKRNAAPGLDLDEDLFNFDEVMPEDSGGIEDELDLDEIFSAFQEEEEEQEEETPEDEPEGEDSYTETPVPPVSTAPAAPAPVAAERVAHEPAHRRAQGRHAEADDEEEEAPKRRKGEVPPRPRGPVRRSRRRSDAPARPSPLAVTFLTKGAVVVLIAMTLLNVSIALVTFSSATGMRAELEAASREMADAALEIRDNVGEQTLAVQQQFSPVVPLTLGESPTLDRAADDIEGGNHAEGRRRIYALLAVIDRQPQAMREELEARSAFLLAHSYHLEAVAAGGDR